MKRKLIFFGAGDVCKHSIGYASAKHMDVAYIVDNNSQKWGTFFQSIPIISPAELEVKMKEDSFEVVITVGPKISGAISNQLQAMGLIYNRDFTTFYDKFFNGTIPTGISPGRYSPFSCEGISLLKPVSDQVLLIDKANSCIYRAVGPEKAQGLKSVYDRINQNKTLYKYIVSTTISQDKNLKLKYPLVFKHEYLPVVSYPSEWSPIMFRDYVLFMIDFMAELDRLDLGLQDPSLFNATYHQGKFVYFDFSGIWWDKTNWFIFRTWFNLHINTLILMKKNPTKAYLYLYPGNPLDVSAFSTVIQFEDIVGYFDESEKEEYLQLISTCETEITQGNVIGVCQNLKSYVERYTSDFTSLSDWTGYQSDLYINQLDNIKYTVKQAEVLWLIRSVKPRTVIDLAGNMAWYGIALSKEVEYAISVDIDSRIIDSAYKKIQEENATNVYPLCVNIMRPSTAYFDSRMQCDFALALAVIHHLALTQALTFEQIVDKLYSYTKKYLLIEFVDPEDPYCMQYLRQFDPDATSWYNKENFEKAFNQKFNLLVKRPSDVLTRNLYLYERRLTDV